MPCSQYSHPCADEAVLNLPAGHTTLSINGVPFASRITSPVVPSIFGFNANNELLLARTAMVGFAVTTLVEATTGRGPLEQLGFELGQSGLKFEEDFFLASAVFFLFSAVFPAGLSQIMVSTKK